MSSGSQGKDLQDFVNLLKELKAMNIYKIRINSAAFLSIAVYGSSWDIILYSCALELHQRCHPGLVPSDPRSG